MKISPCHSYSSRAHNALKKTAICGRMCMAALLDAHSRCLCARQRDTATSRASPCRKPFIYRQYILALSRDSTSLALARFPPRLRAITASLRGGLGAWRTTYRHGTSCMASGTTVRAFSAVQRSPFSIPHQSVRTAQAASNNTASTCILFSASAPYDDTCQLG